MTAGGIVLPDVDDAQRSGSRRASRSGRARRTSAATKAPIRAAATSSCSAKYQSGGEPIKINGIGVAVPAGRHRREAAGADGVDACGGGQGARAAVRRTGSDARRGGMTKSIVPCGVRARSASRATSRRSGASTCTRRTWATPTRRRARSIRGRDCSKDSTTRTPAARSRRSVARAHRVPAPTVATNDCLRRAG